jgi:hypothetical protein
MALIDSHSFGYISSGTLRATLSGTFIPPTSGLYILQIDNKRDAVSSTCIYNYIDNITLVPWGQTLKADVKNIPSQTGATVNFTLSAGAAKGGQEYWLWLNCTGTYPGIKLSGIDIPLNQDPLLDFGLCNPCFPGTAGFMGQLDAYGMANASINMPMDGPLVLTGIPINFAYIVLSPGFSTPITFSSIPVHVMYIP